MNVDVGLSQSAFGLGAGIFFLGYFLFEVPSNLILEKVGARVWIARIMLTWGLVSAAMALVQGPTSFYVLRFLLGVAEAGFFPGIVLYLSCWFPAGHRAKVIAFFMAAAPLSIALGSPLSGALLNLDGLLGLRGWQWMFLLEAAPAILLSGAVFVYLTDKPENASWLGDDERSWLVSAMAIERRATESAHGTATILRALTDRRVLLLAMVYFGTSAGLYTLGIWSPQLIAQHGVSNLTVGFLNAIPPVFAVLAMILWARHSDRTLERHWHVAIAAIVASAGLFLASSSTALLSVVAALVLVNVGVSSAKPPLWSLPTQFLVGSGSAAGIAAINSIGNLGGFAGPAIIGWLKDSTGDYDAGLMTVSAVLLLSAVLVLIQKQNVHPLRTRSQVRCSSDLSEVNR